MTVFLIDLFCGAGGFSEGARQAGCVPLLAVDSWKYALDVHAVNHPDCIHWCEELGGNVVAMADRIRHVIKEHVSSTDMVHIHASPPCHSLSTVSRTRDVGKGLVMINWTLNLLSELKAESWTMEEVSTPEVKECFKAFGGKLISFNESICWLGVELHKAKDGCCDDSFAEHWRPL